MRSTFLFLGLILGFAYLSSWDYAVYERERIEAIPDIAWEYSVLELGDQATDREVLEWYEEHRAFCDSLALENM